MKKVFLVVCAFFLGGCGAMFSGYGDVLNNYSQNYVNYQCSSDFVDEKIKSNDDTLLWSELGGSLQRNCYDYNKSNFYFDISEVEYKNKVDLQNQATSLIKGLGDVIGNDNIHDYQGNVYESILVNVYKGLNFMSLNEPKNARVEFNRALDRQRRAKDHYAKQIQKQIKQLNKENNITKQNSQQAKDTIFQAYESGVFADFKAYKNFVNPFATYMSALFFLSAKDYKKARDLIKESLAMDPKNNFIKDEFKLFNRFARSLKVKEKYIWLIYENGKGLSKDEFRLDVPLFVVSKKVQYAGITLPTLKENESSYQYLSIDDKKTTTISDMDRVIKTEFKIKLPLIITKSIIRTAAKTTLAANAYQKNEIAGTVLSVFDALTNKSDVRSWVALPKNFQALRIINKNKGVIIKTDTNEVLQDIHVSENKNAIIYVNSSQNKHAVVHKIEF